MKNLLTFILFVLANHTFGQTVYTMDPTTNGQTINTCNAIVTDVGGNSFDYASGSNYTLTFCSSDGGPIRFKLEWLNIEGGFDFLEIHDGPTTASPSLANLSGFCLESNACPTLNYTSTGSCLTLHFTSDGSINYDDWLYTGGFMAYINCDPDGCNGNDPAADDCANATPICTLDGYCGTTSQWYTIDAQYTDTYVGNSEFCGSIENNSWLQFTPDATSVTIEVDIFNCFYGDGIQFVLFQGSCASLTQVGTNCWSPIIGLNTLTFTGLTPGNNYYLMIDGFAGDICDYTVTPIAGVETVEVLDALGNISNEGICPGECATLSVNSDTPPTSYNWYSVPAGVSGTGSTVNVCPTQDMTVYVDLGGVCGTSTTADFNITMTPVVYTGLPVTTNCEDVSYNLLAEPEVTPCVYVVLTSNGGFGELTLLEDGVAYWGTNTIDPNAGTIHTFTYYQVSPSAAHSIEFYGNTTSDITYEVFDCANNALLYSGTWSDCGFFPCTQTDPVIAPNVVTGLATWSSTCGGLITTDWGFAVYDPTTATGPFPQSCDITYNWDNESGCSGFDTQNVTITNPYDATFSYSAPSYCQDAADPTPTVTGTGGGTFSAGAGLSINPATGAIDVSASTPGNYTVTYSVGTLPCGATLDVPVSIVAPPNAGTNGTLTVCTNGSVTDLFSLLGGTPQTTGSWSGPSGLTNGYLGTFDPATMSSGVYTYTVSGTAPCVDATATVNVTVNPLPTAVIAGGNTYCQGDVISNITVNVTGTANWTVNYTLNGTPLSANGSSSPISLGNTAGTYVLTGISDANCSNTASGTQTITINPLPTATIGTNATVCQNDASPDVTFTGSNGTAPYTFTYNINGGGNQTVVSDGAGVATVSAPTGTAGTFTYNLVSVEDNNLCSQNQTGSAVITVNPLPTATISSTVTVCENEPSVVVTLTGSNGTVPYTFSYDINGGATQTVVSDGAGVATLTQVTTSPGTFTYNLTNVVDGSTTACSQVLAESITVTVEPTPTVSTVPTDPTVCDGTDGEIQVSGSSSNNVTVSWSGPSSGSAAGVTLPYDITGLASGTYDVTYTDDVTGCTTTIETVSLSNPGAPVLDVINDVSNCDVDFILPAINGTSLNNPQYYDAPGGPAGGGNVVSVGTIYSVPTNITLYAYDENGTCSDEEPFTIVINPLPTATIDTDVTVCVGDPAQTITFTGSNAVAPYTFTYNINGGANQTIVSDGAGIATIAVPTGVAGSFTYNLVDVTDASVTGCSQAQSGSATVTVNPLPTATISGTATVCEGSGDQTITFNGANGTAPYTFTYTVDGGAPQTVVSDMSGVATVNQTSASAGTFTYDLVSVSDASATACSQSQTGTVVITVNPLPTASVAGTIEVCQGSGDQTVTFTGANGTAPYTFTYTVNGGAPQTAVSDGTGMAVVTQATATVGSYTFDLVSVSDASSTACSQAQTGSVTITVNPLPTATISGDVTVCEGSADQTITLNGANGTAPYIFTYTVNGGAPQTVASDATGAATVTQSAATAGVFVFDLVDVTDASASACTQVQTGTATVTVNPQPTATVAGDVSVCEGSGDQTITFTGATGTAPYTFTYTVNGGAPQTIVSDGTGVATVVQSSATAGTYTYDLVSVEDANLCSQAQTGAAVVTVNPLPTASIAGDVQVCEGAADQTVTITGANGTAPYTFTYSVNGGAPQTITSDATGVAAIAQTATASGAFTYDLIDVTDASSTACSQSQTGTVTVLVNPLPTATISGDVAVCEGSLDQQVVITGANGTAPYTFTYTVNGGAPLTVTSDAVGVTILTQSAATAGTFTYDLVDVTDASSTACSQAQSGTVVVTVNPTPTVTGTPTDPTVCNGTDGFITVTGSSSNSVSVTWSGPSTGTQSGVTLPYDITGLGAGTYDLSYVDEVTGCATTVTQAALINPGAPVLDPINDTTVCDQFNLEVIQGTSLSGNETYWSGTGATGTQYNVGDPITSSMTMYAYDANGSCANEVSFAITVNSTPVIDPISDASACGSYTLPGITGTSLSGNEAFYNDSQLNGGTVISGAISTSQTVYVYDANGTCSDEISFNVTINEVPTAIISGGATYCEGDNISDVVVDVTGNANWTIDYTLDGNAMTANGSASPIVLGNTAGTYVLTAISDGNCSNAASGTSSIVINALPPAPTVGTDTTYCMNTDMEPMTASGTGGTLDWYLDTLSSSFGTGASYIPDNNGLGTTVYYIMESVGGCQGPASAVTIDIVNCDITIPTAVTPNGDLNNDTWEILDLDEAYPNNVVQIYNRWGNLIFEHISSPSEPYNQNQWDGTYEGNALPVGSYFYVIRLNDEEVATGAVSIILD